MTVMTSPIHPARLTVEAHKAFLALGYTIEDTRADTYRHCASTSRHVFETDASVFFPSELVHWETEAEPRPEPKFVGCH
ncbi:hypothetical protein [Antarctobacter sp.]|uniref:hypothetical protein n=1 Tax=Antarctobacter sp. TaxID=1872577 RepID=UPI002B2671F7|nr:hypothetical protein [Antarctobacter sp.]